VTFFLALFFVSGFCSLVYEVVWLRLAMGAFGVTAPFVSIFLSVFMLGLGLGSWGAGRLCAGLEPKPASWPLRLYAAAEAIIALSSVAVPLLLDAGRGALRGAAWDSAGYYWATGLLTALILLPWCVCMGATFPLAMAAIRRRPAGGAFGLLYAANVVGAGLGALAAPFVLIERFGFRGTLHAAAALNVAIALAALAASFAAAPREARTPAPAPGRSPFEANPAAPLLLFTTGLAGMAMEVVWTRQFTPYLGNSVYAFAAVLAAYLLATFAGAWAYRALLGKPAAQHDAAWMLAGSLALLPLYAADPFLPLGAAARVALGIVPLCVVMGFLTPSLVDGWSGGDPRRAGAAYAVNIAGCILGPLLAGFVLLPRMGENAALAFLSLPLFAAGLLAALRARGGPIALGRAGAPALFAAASGLAVLMASVSSSFEDGVVLLNERVRLGRDYQANVAAAGAGMERVLQINNVGMTKLTPITKVMAHLPLAFMPRAPRNALVICFGMGTTFRSLRSWGIPSTAVELVPSVPAFFGFFHEDAAAVLASPDARVVIDDGRRFLARTTEVFDVITLDPAPPMSAAGTSFLFSEEFYAAAKARLAPDGIVQVWIMEPLEPAELTAFARAVKNSFPHARAFRSLEGWGWHVLASRAPIPPVAAARLAARMPAAAARDLVELGPHRTAAGQLQAVLGAEVPLDSLITTSDEGLRDDRPINEYYFLRRGLAAR